MKTKLSEISLFGVSGFTMMDAKQNQARHQREKPRTEVHVHEVTIALTNKATS